MTSKETGSMFVSILYDEDLDKALYAMKSGKAPGCDGVPVELYQNSKTARDELYHITRFI